MGPEQFDTLISVISNVVSMLTILTIFVGAGVLFMAVRLALDGR